jgi:LuxR family quorum-sensing system transcriptional regulator CciR
MQFVDFLAASNNATSAGEVFGLLCQVALPLGYEKVAFLALTAEAQRVLAPPESDITPILVSNYPKDFLRRYSQERHHEIDPVLILAREGLTPMVWEDVVSRMRLSEEQKLLNIERQHAGLYNEVTCPVHGPFGQTFALRFAHSQPGACDHTHLSALQVLAIHFYYAFARACETYTEPASSPVGLADAPQIGMSGACNLTLRERECLLWTARGKSASSISIILGLSENTVNFYVKNAMRKLGTTNRVVAVVLAVRSGLIQP